MDIERERAIESKVCQYAKANGFLEYKLTSPTNGLPDRMFIKSGLIFFIEFKSSTGALSTVQRYHIQRIAEHGGVVYVINNVDDGRNLIDNLIKGYPEGNEKYKPKK